jgi:hypothetical protein
MRRSGSAGVTSFTFVVTALADIGEERARPVRSKLRYEFEFDSPGAANVVISPRTRAAISP